MKRTSRSSRLVSSAARSPALAMTGPEVERKPTPSSRAMIWASVVLPSPGGPANSTWSSASPRALAASMNTFRFDRACSWPMNSRRYCGRREVSASSASRLAPVTRRCASVMVCSVSVFAAAVKAGRRICNSILQGSQHGVAATGCGCAVKRDASPRPARRCWSARKRGDRPPRSLLQNTVERTRGQTVRHGWRPAANHHPRALGSSRALSIFGPLVDHAAGLALAALHRAGVGDGDAGGDADDALDVVGELGGGGGARLGGGKARRRLHQHLHLVEAALAREDQLVV